MASKAIEIFNMNEVIVAQLTSWTALASNRLWLENLKPKELLSEGPSSTYRRRTEIKGVHQWEKIIRLSGKLIIEFNRVCEGNSSTHPVKKSDYKN